MNLALMRRIDELFMKYPFYGSRQMARQLRREGIEVGRHRVRRLMRLMGLEAIYQAPKTSVPHPAHWIYPYLLKGLVIDRPNQVGCADITYIPVQRGFLYLVAIMDWTTRHVLSWRLSNTMDAGFCVEALQRRAGPIWHAGDIQHRSGPQFTSFDFSGTLKDAGVAISMDGRGRSAWTTSSLSACGARSSMRPSTCMSSPTASRPNGSSANGWVSTTPSGPISP